MGISRAEALEEADRDRVSVEYLNGERAVTRSTLRIRRDPGVRPGSTIRVPFAAGETGTDWGEFFTRTLSITSTLVTILLSVERL